MRRVALNFLRTSTGLLLPTLFLTACPGDDTSQTSSDTEDTSETTDSDSEDPTSNTNTDPDTSTTVDPDTSATMTTTMTTDESSSSTDPTDATESSSSTDPTDATESSSSGMPELCGNGEIDEGEDCDGDNLGGADCIGQDFDGGELACDACAFDTSACINFACGNAMIEGKEICDGADLGGADCISEGFPLGGELGCTKNCGDFDTSGCILSVCGNDIAEDVEVCDGMDLAGQDCTTQGDFVGGTLSCNGDCGDFDTTQCVAEICGDGIISGTEVCDGDAFAPNACTDAGFDGGTPGCAADCQSITTDSCFGEHIYCISPNLPISSVGAPLVLSPQAVAGLAGQVVDLDVSVNISHTYVSDLDIIVQHLDNAVSTELSTDQCSFLDNIDATFDQDAAALPDCVEPIAIEGTVLPEGNLDTLAGQVGAGNGNWQLSVQDQFNLDGGTINEWCLEITTAQQMGQQVFNYTGNAQQFVVPNGVFTVTIDASGAQGGGLANLGGGGLGAQIVGDFDVVPGQVLTVIVGQQGLLQVGGQDQNSSGGGGGSFVYDGNNLFVAAAGGGGRCNYAFADPLHVGAAGSAGDDGGNDGSGVYLGGLDGQGGAAGLWSNVPDAGGGAGWLSDGGGPYGGLNADGGWAGGPGFCGGGGGGCGGVGGYGGGGGGGNHYGGGGGGGGYSGGAGGTDPTHGGGGGSFNGGDSPFNVGGVNDGNGVVIISWG
jgi:hypothetical protein